jgi:hypothetical protein
MPRRSDAVLQMMYKNGIPKSARFNGMNYAHATVRVINTLLWPLRLRVRVKAVRNLTGTGSYLWVEAYQGTDPQGKDIWQPA